ncbi:bifunctional 4-hydroxy-2-oxoglutarate aldolase/2-dehydro-3-deoxy-phosphogluconate aldolase [Pontiella sulfatireligans]|uniref:KHG/KDPG aldolase n=1 Tax=Pontiella sulfatireligans TaxID=2750658 RepID=A0A6C2UTV5_9BACT|nr:bifunctional 4-hydroxy-2-oxoglutarate aldolase/2-dehydro-3-deoxy-phosphogluconate aldolase [Pontiella sulfatireligans]VGO22664.1 Putative KHG/KDPG aldolase [Pontiella sulfatireligans]
MLNELLKRPVIPVIVIDDANDAVPLAEALLAGGMDVIEVTCRTASAAEALARIKKALPEMLLGAGTVVTPDQAKMCIDTGISFGLAPGLNPDTVKYFQDRNTLFIPGVMTPSEIEQGLSFGLKMLKFFPAGAAGGVNMLKNLGGPYASQGVQFCPTGGLSLDNMNDYLSLPIVSAIGGSWLATKQQIADKQWGVITQQVKDALAKATEVVG